MGALHKIAFDCYEDNFSLIALHSNLDDFVLAYTLNVHLNSSFKKCPKELDFAGKVLFPYFEWTDPFLQGYWTLVCNKSSTVALTQTEGLFQTAEERTQYHLIPEYKKVNYFIKIEQDTPFNDAQLVEKLNAIPKIATAYSIDTNTLKSINNLIF